ncbi:MAG TPA: cytochrome c [Capsulimonadaceae bacterium]|nr:cytochrome c [Capsulimonadaceae bacterium]
MADTNQSGREMKGLLLAAIAGILVVALAFGFAAIMRGTLPVGGSSSGPAAPVSATPETAVTPAMLATGGQLFKASCAGCHGPTGAGVNGPNLHHLRIPDQRIESIIKNGKGAMPAFGSLYSDSQIGDIAAFVRTLK